MRIQNRADEDKAKTFPDFFHFRKSKQHVDMVPDVMKGSCRALIMNRVRVLKQVKNGQNWGTTKSSQKVEKPSAYQLKKLKSYRNMDSQY